MSHIIRELFVGKQRMIAGKVQVKDWVEFIEVGFSQLFQMLKSKERSVKKENLPCH